MMKVIKAATKFQRVGEIVVPDVFNRRFKTGVNDLDIALGGDGFVPGSTFTLAGEPGAGKTTLLLQVLELLEKSGKHTAYISGEESIYQLAFVAHRLQLQKVSIANMTCIEDIFDSVKENNFGMIVLDSLPSLRSRDEDLRGKALEEYLANYITATAKEYEVVVGIVLHITKQGKYKGSTLLPHSVDANIMLRKSEEDYAVREIEVTKNRFGSAGFTVFPISNTGFVFESLEASDEEGPKVSKAKKTSDDVLEYVSNHGSINASEAAKVIGDVSKVQKIMKDLVNAGLLNREGRAANTVWSAA
jgi:DNA repair protein RadA/Sms